MAERSGFMVYAKAGYTYTHTYLHVMGMHARGFLATLAFLLFL